MKQTAHKYCILHQTGRSYKSVGPSLTALQPNCSQKANLYPNCLHSKLSQPRHSFEKQIHKNQTERTGYLARVLGRRRMRELRKSIRFHVVELLALSETWCVLKRSWRPIPRYWSATFGSRRAFWRSRLEACPAAVLPICLVCCVEFRCGHLVKTPGKAGCVAPDPLTSVDTQPDRQRSRKVTRLQGASWGSSLCAGWLQLGRSGSCTRDAAQEQRWDA